MTHILRNTCPTYLIKFTNQLLMHYLAKVFKAFPLTSVNYCFSMQIHWLHSINYLCRSDINNQHITSIIIQFKNSTAKHCAQLHLNWTFWNITYCFSQVDAALCAFIYSRVVVCVPNASNVIKTQLGNCYNLRFMP